MLNDIRHGLRVLLQAKGWTVVVVLSLALGIGANTALFSGVHALLLRDLPVEDPQSLVRLRYSFERSNDMTTGTSDYGQSDAPVGVNVRASFSYRMFRELRAANTTLEDMVACAPMRRMNVVVDGAGAVANGFISTGNFYDVLGVRATIGRAIAVHDDRPSAPPVAVVSHEYWQSRFGGDPRVVGKVVRVGDTAITIVGVLPPDFTGVQRTTDAPPDIAFPLALDAQLTAARPGEPHRLSHPSRGWLQILGRLKPGVTAEQVHQNLGGVFRLQAKALLNEHLASLPEAERFNSRNRSRTELPTLVVDSGAYGIYRAARSDVRSARILGVVVVLVLLIVCANVANLLLARATAREKEMSVRLSSGATRGRLIRQLLTESVMLALIGGAPGILVGYWSTRLLPGALGTVSGMDWPVLGFTLLVTTATGIVFGIAPALRATRVDIATTLKENSRGIGASRTLLSKSLVIVQVALSVLLLVGAGLLVRTLQNLRQADVGFNTQNLVLFDVDPQLIQYQPSRFAALYEDLMLRVRAVPGVHAVTFSENALLTGASSSMDIFVEGSEADVKGSINRLIVWPNFFDTMGMPLIAGRQLALNDIDRTPNAVVLNQTAARRFFPNQSPIGRRFGSAVEKSSEFEVVGVLRDAKYSSIRHAAPPTMYVSYLPGQPRGVVFEVRTAGNPIDVIPRIREAARSVQPDLPITNVTTQAEEIEEGLEQERLLAHAYAAFGALAVVVASVGLFGLMSYSVTKRTKEMGIRLAIGAAATDVLWLVLRDSLMLVGVGIAIGLVGVIAARGLVASLLYGVTSTDGVTILLASALMLSVSALAGYLPARRAARVDPMIALRYE